jgi:hypothetical protein
MRFSWTNTADETRRVGETDDETAQRPSKQITIPHNSLSRTRGIQDPQQLFQVIVHQTVKEDLVLIAHRGEKGVLEDDGGLFLELVVGSGDPAA